MIQLALRSLPLLVTIGLLAWSFREGLAVLARTPSVTLAVFVTRGQLHLSWGDNWQAGLDSRIRVRRIPPLDVGEADRRLAKLKGTHHHVLGFEWHTGATPFVAVAAMPLGGPGGLRSTEIVVPAYVLTMTAALPVLMLIHREWRSARWRSQGLCPSCGFDLRATPDRCPECGVETGKPQVASPT